VGEVCRECGISGFSSEVDEICALLGYYTAYSGRQIRCVLSHTSVDLIYFAAETWNPALFANIWSENGYWSNHL